MLFDAVNDVRNQASWRDVWERMLTPNRAEFRRQHQQIVNAIASRNPAAAAKSMQTHLHLVREAISSPVAYARFAHEDEKQRLAPRGGRKMSDQKRF
jgi:DNA-binding GntR family transcriptional regulator